MNLEDALRCLFLRHLRIDRLEAETHGDNQLSIRLTELATIIAIDRDKNTKQYRVTLAGTGHSWTFPESEFVFYARGDHGRSTEMRPVNAEDAIYEKNLLHAKKWIGVFREALHA